MSKEINMLIKEIEDFIDNADLDKMVITENGVETEYLDMEYINIDLYNILEYYRDE